MPQYRYRTVVLGSLSFMIPFATAARAASVYQQMNLTSSNLAVV